MFEDGERIDLNQSKSGKVECQTYKSSFNTYKDLSNHARAEHSGKFKSPERSKIFDSIPKLVKHKKFHEKNEIPLRSLHNLHPFK